MLFEVAKERENSWDPPEEEVLLAEVEQPERARAAMVGTARAPTTFNPAERRCCVMSSLSDFVVEESGVVTPVTHKYAGDV
jgi:hypothetical protein